MRLEVNIKNRVGAIYVYEYVPSDYKLLVATISSVFPNPFTVVYQSIQHDTNTYTIYGFRGEYFCARDLELFDDALWKRSLEITESNSPTDKLKEVTEELEEVRAELKHVKQLNNAHFEELKEVSRKLTLAQAEYADLQKLTLSQLLT